MTKNGIIPTSILSFVKKSNSIENGDDDDRAFLLPSNGSSFNLAGDSSYTTLPKSTSHHSTTSVTFSRSSKSSRASSSSGGHRQQHHRRRSSSGGDEVSKKKSSSPRQRELDTSQLHDSYSSHLSERTSSTVGSRGSHHAKFSNQSSRHQGRRSSRSPRNYERQRTSPFPENKNGSIPLKKSSSLGKDPDRGYFLGYDSGNIPRGLSPIAASTSFQSNQSKLDGNVSPSINTIHSGRSYKTQKSAISNTSVKSARRRGKMKREEKRREWIRRWRRRRLMGTIILTVIYSLLFAYTLLVTLGPLALHLLDPIEWCPYLWDESHYAENEAHHSGYSLNIDQLQQSRQRQQELGNKLHRRRLTPQIDEFSDNENAGSDNNQDDGKQQSDSGEAKPKYENPDYDDSPCRITRIPFLLYLTLEECDLSRRMAVSVLLGGLIGYERRASDRPAGIRTMALVALGSCFFTISSQLTFRDSPMTWDSSRVTAAIPSGVGFLGAGLIWKGSLSDGSGNEVHQVHGITTAASVWLAAAVGVGAGGALYVVSIYSTALIILVLRFGPRLYLQNDRGFEDDDEEEEDEEDDEEIEDVDDRKYGKALEEAIPTHYIGHSNFEMHHMDHSTNDTTTLKTDAAKYGAIDIEENTVVQLLQQDQRRQVERLNRVGGGDRSTAGPLSWLTKLLPGKERRQPLNPYQAITRDREVMRMMKKKKSMSKMNSRPSFCT
mmetsp:Transcript_23912/g.51640  ORF Transcript_23912/g.51640 Transcript_23912/m.51640 type:complete len:718 (-) Transcript_23912:136-2289(-)|eukprot:CAMPEP_0172320820 /NCGR_PEP_ID=MMETSP1058-20130122/41525_1 /TAXON_ID=83371 /ORGANISM="Detonula confervacea, Strain CCMP 353" /LENGTH=717 /DNA_ID=CAMNT_0013036171 /DNA_START=57 /DNA_END=2210 /DNA_ORIENTATION=+